MLLQRVRRLPILSRHHVLPLRVSHSLPSRLYASKPHDKASPLERTSSYLTTPSESIARANRVLVRGLTSLLALFVVSHIFVTYFYAVEGAWGISMLPTIASSGDWLLISKYYRRGRGVAVGDLVSFRLPTNEREYAVKRVVGLPGDFVLRDTPGHSPAMIQVPRGHCWVVGDNLTWSRDSRIYGPLPLALVNGKVLAKWSGFFAGFERLHNGLRPALDDNEVD